jgi:hypothetical protein
MSHNTLVHAHPLLALGAFFLVQRLFPVPSVLPSIIRIAIAAAAAQLQHHMDSRPRGNVVTLERFVVGQLLARMDQLDLIDLYALLFLQGLLDLQDLVVRFEVERLLAARQGLDVNLMSFVVVIVHQRACISWLWV